MPTWHRLKKSVSVVALLSAGESDVHAADQCGGGDNCYFHGFFSLCWSMMRRIKSETVIPSRAASF
jgi:hypothetical protein